MMYGNKNIVRRSRFADGADIIVNGVKISNRASGEKFREFLAPTAKMLNSSSQMLVVRQ